MARAARIAAGTALQGKPCILQARRLTGNKSHHRMRASGVHAARRLAPASAWLLSAPLACRMTGGSLRAPASVRETSSIARSGTASHNTSHRKFGIASRADRGANLGASALPLR